MQIRNMQIGLLEVGGSLESAVAHRARPEETAAHFPSQQLFFFQPAGFHRNQRRWKRRHT